MTVCVYFSGVFDGIRRAADHLPDVLLPRAVYLSAQIRLHCEQALGRTVSDTSPDIPLKTRI